MVLVVRGHVFLGVVVAVFGSLRVVVAVLGVTVVERRPLVIRVVVVVLMFVLAGGGSFAGGVDVVLLVVFELASSLEGKVLLHLHVVVSGPRSVCGRGQYRISSVSSVVQHLCAVRLGTKSTIEESRVERFIGIGARNKGLLPIPLKYYGAHTGRWAGADSVNFQNLPSRDKKKKALKNSISAPDDHIVINCDSSQIEARVLAWLAGQDDVTEQFRKGDDVYSIFATKIYKQPISKANPVERFVGKTCILGLGYGTGAAKLRHTLKTQPPGADLSEEECKRIVDLYRSTNDKIVELWRECDYALKCMMSWPEGKAPFYLGVQECVVIDSRGIRLPNGLYIRYPNLRSENDKLVYDSRKGTVSIWGGAMVENVVQALARIVVGEQMLNMRDTYRPVLTVHDAAVIVAPKPDKDQALAFITQVMSTAPNWATGLPIACEAKCGESYGEC